MVNIKSFIKKIFILSILIVCSLTVMVYAQDNNVIHLYNRNEKVSLSKPLIHKNDDYYIFIDDLYKINIQYKSIRTYDGVKFTFYSEDVFGIENELVINITSSENKQYNDNINDFDVIKSYSFSNHMISKKCKLHNAVESGQESVDIGNFESVVIEENNYFISIKTIATAISYEYIVADDFIKLWITDVNHHMVNGEIHLPEDETAPKNGVDVNILILSGNNNAVENYTFKKVNIPEGKNNIYYFAETDVFDYYNWLMFEFESNHKTVNKFVNLQKGSLVDVTAVECEKTTLVVGVSMPGQLVAAEDIYTTVIFDNFSVYKSDTPVIKKGEKFGKITFNIDKGFTGKVVFADITGDSRLFSYGYYGYGELNLLSENARVISAGNGNINATLLQCYEISGQVLPSDINSGYKVRVFGFTNSGEKIYISGDVKTDFTFKVKVPAPLPEYTLSVAYKPGAYCGYISDGVSSYNGEYHIFKNICDYSDIKLKYEPFLPDFPVDINVDKNIERVKLRNLSDNLIKDVTLYCAYYRDEKLIYITDIPINNIMVYSDNKSYKVELPTEFYKSDEVKFFVYNDFLKPLSFPVSKKVNEPYFPEDSEFIDVNFTSEFYQAIKNMYLAGVMLGYEDGLFRPDNYVMRNEAAAMICKMLGYWCNTYNFSCEDVPKKNWESSYVGICVNENIFELENNMFRPYDNITVNEVYSAISNLIKKADLEINTEDLLINIDTENSDRDIKRAEFAQIMYNYKNLKTIE